ncbi:MAG: outer membrane beta-barrel protein [Alphaproteobacteria bacterium]|nr:outer membrane beta-barrel protein [Alphaproteobacteria bacterium]
MKTLYILTILAFLPFGTFAQSYIKPFIGYNIGVAGTNNQKIKYDDGDSEKQEIFTMNYDRNNHVVLGLEIGDIMALSLDPSERKIKNDGTTTIKTGEVDVDLDIYLTRKSNFKPYLSLGAGYTWTEQGVASKYSGTTFNFGIGCRQYVTDNVFFNAKLDYGFSTKMKVKGDYVEDNTQMYISGFDFVVGAGYRF